LRDGRGLSFYHYQVLVVDAYHMALCTSNKKTREKAVAFKNHTHLLIGTPAWVLLGRRNEAEKSMHWNKRPAGACFYVSAGIMRSIFNQVLNQKAIFSSLVPS
jgi:hypothetical protein